MNIIFVIPLLAALFTIEPARAATLPGIPEFIDEMVEKHQFKREELKQAFDRAQYLPTVIDIISRPTVSKPWLEYRAAFVNPERVKYGLNFWNKYQHTLRRAEREFGIPQEIIVALIGVETIYGQDAGTFRILDALTTLAFDYPRRGEFFRSELENYLLLARDQQFDMLSIRGSYAGAIGIPQFMPSSYRSYAVDYNGNHKTDLMREPGDAIGSVANYLKKYGWTNGVPVAVRAQIVKKDWMGEVSTRHTLEEWLAAGIAPRDSLPPRQLARLLDFTVENGKELWLVFNDFDVITRYNNSDFYAMTVFQLAQELKAARKVSSAK